MPASTLRWKPITSNFFPENKVNYCHGKLGFPDQPRPGAAVSRRLLGPLEPVQRDAIVQSLLDYHGSKVKTAESPGVSRATIYRKIRQCGIITPAS